MLALFVLSAEQLTRKLMSHNRRAKCLKSRVWSIILNPHKSRAEEIPVYFSSC